MSNVTTGPVYVIDTPATLLTRIVKLRGVRWVGATTSGHTVSITDGNDAVVWASIAGASNWVEADRPDIVLTGLKVATLQSGLLYLDLA